LENNTDFTPEAEEAIPAATSIAVRVSTFFAGAILMSLEILGFRIIGKTFGSALRETSVVIAVFLTAMSVGYYFGGRSADRRPTLRSFLSVLGLAAVMTALVPTLDRSLSSAVFASGLPLALHSTVVTVILFFVPTALLAAVSPFAIRLLSRSILHSGATAGSLSAISTMGSIVGSIGTAFVLIDYFESVHRTVYALSILTALLIIGTATTNRLALPGRFNLPVLWRTRRFEVISGAILMTCSLVAACSFVLAQPFGTRVFLRGTDNQGIFQRDSTFHHIIVRDHDRFRTLYFDHHPQTQMNLDDRDTGGFPYTDIFHVPMIINPTIRNVLFIGVGGGTGPSTFVHHYPRVEVDAVDVDPVVLEVAQRFFGLQPGNRLKLFAEDGRTFVKRNTKLYDLVVIDAYSTNRYGSTIPAHLTTREFFAETASRMSSGGMLVYNSAAVPSSPITRALAKTLYRSFPYQIAFTAGSNTILIGSREDIRLAMRDLPASTASALASGAVRNATLPMRIKGLIPPMQVRGAPVLTDDYAPVDRLLRGR